MTTTIRIEFSTREFFTSHGRQPRGYGSWMFKFEGREVTFHSNTYAEARARCVAAVKAAAPADYVGTVVVEVMS